MWSVWKQLPVSVYTILEINSWFSLRQLHMLFLMKLPSSTDHTFLNVWSTPVVLSLLPSTCSMLCNWNTLCIWWIYVKMCLWWTNFIFLVYSTYSSHIRRANEGSFGGPCSAWIGRPASEICSAKKPSVIWTLCSFLSELDLRTAVKIKQETQPFVPSLWASLRRSGIQIGSTKLSFVTQVCGQLWSVAGEQWKCWVCPKCGHIRPVARWWHMHFACWRS